MIAPAATRRHVLLLTTGALALASRPHAARAMIEANRALIAGLLAGRMPLAGRISLSLPAVAEDGSVVPLTVAVASPMTDADHVQALHILAESNPEIRVLTFRFTPMSGRAELSTRIRLARSQTVWALAEMSDGQAALERADIAVTIGGCGG